MNQPTLTSGTATASPTIKHDRTAWLRGGDARCLMPPNRPEGKIWRIVLLGPPGVGKGTQAEMICARLGTCHLSTGDVFRAAKCMTDGDLTPAMQSALDFMRRGDLVPDETVLNMVSERLRCLSCCGGFLLDGFPRTVAQAKALDQLLDSHHIPVSVVVNYDLPIEDIVARISGRRTCASCKAVYHLTNRPPKAADLCDHCGGKLFQREDDRPESVQVRMEAYQNSTRPLTEFYLKRGLLVTVSADGTPKQVFERTFQQVFRREALAGV